MFQKSGFVALRRAAASALLLLMAVVLNGCLGDSEAAKKRLLETGNKYYDTGKFKEASIIYRKVLQKDQKYGEAYYRLGLSELKQGRYGDSVRWLRRASELQPENDDAHAKLGDLYLTIYLADRGKYKQLLVDFQELSEKLLKRNPKHFEGLRMRGYLAVANENWKEAITYFQQADSVKPDQGHVQLALAQAMVADKQADEAIALVKKSLDKNKQYGPLYDFLYAASMSRKDVPGAEAILEQKVANNSNTPAFLLEMAGHYFRMKQDDKVQQTISRLTADPKKFPDAYRLAGDFYFRTQKFDRAFAAYDQGANSQADQKATFRKKQVELLALQNKREEAVALAQKVVAEYPDDHEAKALRASLRLQGGDKKELDTAIAEFQSVLNKMQDNPVVRFNLGEAYLAKGDTDAARTQFSEAIKLRPSYVPPKLALGRIHLAKREYARAQQLADEILQTNGGFLPARLLRVSALTGLQDAKTARKELEFLLEKVPGLADARYLMALLDLAEKRLPESEAGFKQLMDKKDPRGMMGLVEVLMATNRAPQAKQILENSLKEKPANATAVKLALANISLRSQNFDDAATQYQALIQENPKSAGLYLRLGETYYNAKRYDEAAGAFSKAGELAPAEVDPVVRLAMAYEKSGKKDMVKPLYDKILQLQPDNYIALNNVAYMLVESGGDINLALTYVQKARQQEPNNPDIADTLGWIYLKKNQPDDAIKIFRNLLEKKPESVLWRYHIAEAFFQKGDKLQARKELEQAIKNKPSADEKQKIERLMSRLG